MHIDMKYRESFSGRKVLVPFRTNSGVGLNLEGTLTGWFNVNTSSSSVQAEVIMQGRDCAVTLEKDDLLPFNRLLVMAMVLDSEPDPIYVNIYGVSRTYRGPEEGGWYSDSHEPKQSARVDNMKQAKEFQAWLLDGLKECQPRHNRYSVLGGEDIEVYVENGPGRFDPGITHYE